MVDCLAMANWLGTAYRANTLHQYVYKYFVTIGPAWYGSVHLHSNAKYKCKIFWMNFNNCQHVAINHISHESPKNPKTMSPMPNEKQKRCDKLCAHWTRACVCMCMRSVELCRGGIHMNIWHSDDILFYIKWFMHTIASSHQTNRHGNKNNASDCGTMQLFTDRAHIEIDAE